MNLYNFIENLKSVSLSHYDVNEFKCGDIYDIMNKKYHKYPCIVLTIDSIQKGTNDTNIVNGNLFYIDRQLADESNKLYIQSQGVSVLNNIFNKSYKNIGYPFDTQQFTPFSEKFADLCAGAYCTFSGLVDIEDICEDGFVGGENILKIVKNGIYDVKNYDKVDVEVEGTGDLQYYWIMPYNQGVPTISLSDLTSTFEIKFRRYTDTTTIYDDGYTSLIYEDNQFKARLNGGEWLETLVRETDVKTHTVKLTGTKLQIDYYTFDLVDGGHKWDYGQQLYIGPNIDIYYCKYIFANGGVASDYEPNIMNGETVLKDAVSGEEMNIEEEIIFIKEPYNNEGIYSFNTGVDIRNVVKIKTKFNIPVFSTPYDVVFSVITSKVKTQLYAEKGILNYSFNNPNIVNIVTEKIEEGEPLEVEMTENGALVNGTFYKNTNPISKFESEEFIHLFIQPITKITGNIIMDYIEFYDKNDKLIFSANGLAVKESPFAGLYDNVNKKWLNPEAVARPTTLEARTNNEIKI